MKNFNITYLLLAAFALIFPAPASCADTTFSKGDNSKFKALTEHLNQSNASSMLIVVDGKEVFKWGNTEKKHLVHSIRKALLNALIGIEVDAGNISLEQTLDSLHVDDQPTSLTKQELQAKFSDVLKSRSGIYLPAAAVNDGMLKTMPARGQYQPNEHYYYNNWDFNVAGHIYEKLSGKSVYRAFLEKIAQPLKMKHYQGVFQTLDTNNNDVYSKDIDGFYQFERHKSQFPAYHFRLSSHDLALFGQLYLQHGQWQGKQIISKDWIDKSTQLYSLYDANRGLGYGMLWRVVRNEKAAPEQRTSFYHTGLGIHMLGIYPSKNMVMVHRVDTESDVHYEEADFYKMLRLTFAAIP